MSEMSWDEWQAYIEPLRWQGDYVYIRSIESIGFVSSSFQNSGDPTLNKVTVSLLEPNARYWSARDITVDYTMDEARRDLMPGVRYLIREAPEVTDG